ncbi:MAG TPA: hypothetical protein ENI05_08890 [Porticoccus sp.]|nr:hypothetical protein [Porticoccus sp.]
MAQAAQFQKRYQRTESTSGTGAPHSIRDEMKGFNTSLTFSIRPDPTGTGKFQTTLEEDLDKIKNDPGNVDWDDWALGSVSVLTQDITTTSITGWRLIADSGTVKGEIRGAF